MSSSEPPNTLSRPQPTSGPTAPTSPPNTPPSAPDTPAQQAIAADIVTMHSKIPYSAAFTDSLATLLLSPRHDAPPTATSRRGAAATASSNGTSGKSSNSSSSHKANAKEDGIRVLPPGSAETPTPGTSVRIEDISAAALPTVDAHELPLPLDDPRRIYASGVPGLRLTHPGGWLEGGAAAPHPAADAPLQAAAQQHMAAHGLGSPAALRAHVAAETAAAVDALRARLRERRGAAARNDRVARDIADLVAERDMERRVHERQMAMRRQQSLERQTRRGGDADRGAEAG